MNSPTISVIIPTYNVAHYLGEAIESVLNQSLRPQEIIIIDDGSTDSTKTVVERFARKDIHYIYQQNAGAGSARNTGVLHAKNEWIAFLDSDDLWLPSKLELQWQYSTQTEVAILFTHIQQFISQELCVDKLSTVKINHEILPGYCSSTLFIKKSLFQEIGLFNVNYHLGEFIAWYMNLRKSTHPYYLLNDVLVRRRIHRSNTSTKNKLSRHDYLHLLYEAKR